MRDPLRIEPLAHPPQASVRVPGSKSLTNRAVIIAALAHGNTTLHGALESDDTRHCVNALLQLGFEIERAPETLRVRGLGGRIPARAATLLVGNAGTAARFLTAMLTLGTGSFVVDGEPRMRERPIADLVTALNALGATVSAPSGCPPVTVQASGLAGGTASIASEVSSQFLSAVLMAAPYARQPVRLELAGALNSRPYVTLTSRVMADFGAPVHTPDPQTFVVQPGVYQAQADYAIESDATAASYFWAVPALCGGRVLVQHLSRASAQGDVAFVDVLARMGCDVTETPAGLAVSAPPAALIGVDVDMRDIPDTAQTLAVIAPFARTPTRIRGIASARLKETDRVAALCTELTRLNVQVDEHPDGLTIYPAADLRPAVIETYNDHRMAMAFSLIGLRVPGVHIANPACVNKTFPRFFQTLDTLRG